MTAYLGIFATFFSLFIFIKYLLFMEMRVDVNTFKTLYDLCKKDRKFLVREEFISENRYPSIYEAYCCFAKTPWFYLNHSERLMTAGWQGKDQVTQITCFRWSYSKLKTFLFTKLKESHLELLGIPVSLMLPHYTDKIGTLKGIIESPLLDIDWKHFEKEVEEVHSGQKLKTSALLYGPPGNGKTYFIKYLAYKYQLPIMIFTLSPEWSNHDLLLVFSQIPKKCIVLFEDFDNYFDKRKCLLGERAKFTYDIILNGLDGVYNTYENVIFIMTVNDIEKVDDALKSRPSRFKYVRQIKNPSLETKKQLIGDWATDTKDLNLDQVFRMKEYQDEGLDLVNSLKRLEKKADEETLLKLAFQRYQERLLKNEEGSPEEDWEHAEKGFSK